MFAGRYLWWMLIAAAIFLFFSMCFDYATWTVVAISGCAEIAGSCGPIVLTMSGAMKPAGIGLAGAIMVFCTFARLRYLSVKLALGALRAHLVFGIGSLPGNSRRRLDGPVAAGNGRGRSPGGLPLRHGVLRLSRYRL